MKGGEKLKTRRRKEDSDNVFEFNLRKGSLELEGLNRMVRGESTEEPLKDVPEPHKPLMMYILRSLVVGSMTDDSKTGG
ncbi:hypothetical protein M1146_03830 [Patescibacteria group bacterium]|nr:hypothetical protein [Patescibacteria group bacterium]